MSGIRLRALGVLLPALVALGCGGATNPKLAQQDETLRQSVESSDSAEAREWLKGPAHAWWTDKAAISALVGAFYAAGAEKVVVSDIIRQDDGSEVSASIIVVVPSDPEARKRVFALDSRASLESQQDPQRDEGQKYLYYGFD